MSMGVWEYGEREEMDGRVGLLKGGGLGGLELLRLLRLRLVVAEEGGIIIISI